MKAIKTTLRFAALSGLLMIHAHAASETFKLDEEGYIRNWLMLAPINLPEGRPAGDLLLTEQLSGEASLQPKAGDKVKINGKELIWKNITAAKNFFDFNVILDSLNDRAAGFMVTYIECDEEIPDVTMSVGSNDQGRIYFNGIDIYAFTDARQLELDADKGRVTLKKGINVIVFKIINEQNSWQGAMRLQEKNGAPLKNVKIKLTPNTPVTLKEAFQKSFLVGTAINRNMATGTADGRRSQDLVDKDIAVVKTQFNQITAENDMKWQLIHPQEGPGGYDFAPADAFVEFGERNNMYLVGHTLVWHSQTPNWVFAGSIPPPEIRQESDNANPGNPTATPPGRRPNAGGFDRFRRGYNGPRASRDELLARMRDHIHTVVGRYKGKIKSWDVVNEAIADGNETNILRKTLWLEIIGPDFIAKAFEYAHEADPEAILRYNDYGLENPVKRQKLITLIKSLKEQGVPIMAIGSQAHVNVATTFETMDQTLTDLETLGLPIHITELDINTAAAGQRATGADIAGNAAVTQGGQVENAEQRLSDAYAGLFRAFLKHQDHLEMVTFWGVNDGVSWRRSGSPLLFDGNNEPKPAFDAVMRVASENRTLSN